MMEAIGLSPAELAYCAAALFVAGFVRGYSGFGFSALVMTSLALVIPPVQIVPITLVLEVLATLVLYRGIRGYVAWRLLIWVLLAAAMATPLGLVFLSQLSPDVVRMVLAVFILGACVFLWRGASHHRWARGAVPAFLAGIVSGIANGVAAVGGLPAVIFLVAAIPNAAAFRATAMAYLLLLNVYGFSATVIAGLVDGQVLLRLALFAIPALLGVMAGNRHFLNANPDSFRRFAIGLLAVLAMIVMLKVLLA
ncbi:MAG: sulfite exporter TauE/SafE family protein [Alphaproteobacteria bacterium]|nr:sulfite exporter TauE/SafE family protein [Alphaproteobacteria bacterium]